MTSWVQTDEIDPKTGRCKMVPKHMYQREDPNAPFVQGDIVDFQSPITKEMITDRAQLRRHNAAHGVTNSEDYSEGFLKSRSMKREDEMMGRTAGAREERRALITKELIKHGY